MPLFFERCQICLTGIDSREKIKTVTDGVRDAQARAVGVRMKDE